MVRKIRPGMCLYDYNERDECLYFGSNGKNRHKWRDSKRMDEKKNRHIINFNLLIVVLRIRYIHIWWLYSANQAENNHCTIPMTSCVFFLFSSFPYNWSWRMQTANNTQHLTSHRRLIFIYHISKIVPGIFLCFKCFVCGAKCNRVNPTTPRFTDVIHKFVHSLNLFVFLFRLLVSRFCDIEPFQNWRSVEQPWTSIMIQWRLNI